MGYQQRNDSHTGWFHVVNRGARRYDIFIDDDDREAYLSMLATQTAKYGIEVSAFCLMANHFHLVVWCPVGNLSTLMKVSTSHYVRHFNRIHGFSGPLFERRFFSDPIESDDELLTITRYVHRNPLEVALDIAAYPWSSYLDFVDEPTHVPRFRANKTVPLQLAGGSDPYRRFVEQDLPSDKATYDQGRRILTPSSKGRTSASLDEIERALIRVLPTEIERSTRRNALVRQLAVQIAVDSGAHSLDEITAFHGYGSTKSTRSALRRSRIWVERDPEASLILRRAAEVLGPAFHNGSESFV